MKNTDSSFSFPPLGNMGNYVNDFPDNKQKETNFPFDFCRFRVEFFCLIGVSVDFVVAERQRSFYWKGFFFIGF